MWASVGMIVVVGVVVCLRPFLGNKIASVNIFDFDGLNIDNTSFYRINYCSVQIWFSNNLSLS